MTTSFTSDDLQSLLKFPFDDARWKNKLLIGSLLLLAGYFIPLIPMVFVYGYCAQIMERLIVERGGPFLPEWDDWGRLFNDGLKLIGVGLVYILPLFVFFCAGYGLFMGMIFGLEAVENASDPEVVSPLFTLIPLLGMLILATTFGLGFLGIIAASIILPAAVGHVLATGQFAAGFRASEWWPIFRANLGGYLISYALLLGAWIVLSFILQILYFTLVLCCLVPFIMAAFQMYTMLIGSVLFGRAYRAGADKVGAGGQS